MAWAEKNLDIMRRLSERAFPGLRDYEPLVRAARTNRAGVRRKKYNARSRTQPSPYSKRSQELSPKRGNPAIYRMQARARGKVFS